MIKYLFWWSIDNDTLNMGYDKLIASYYVMIDWYVNHIFGRHEINYLLNFLKHYDIPLLVNSPLICRG